MIVASASVPNPPLLLPGMTGGPVVEVEQLRAACFAALDVVLGADPDYLVLVGGIQAAELADPAGALAELVGRSLLGARGWTGELRPHLVPADAAPEDCWLAGQALAGEPHRVGLVAMADGSACRTVKAPGYLDERAAVFDQTIVSGLRASDWTGLWRLDPVVAAQLLVAGRAAWQVMAGALSATGANFAATEHYLDDPFGVLYPVYSFLPR